MCVRLTPLLSSLLRWVHEAAAASVVSCTALVRINQMIISFSFIVQPKKEEVIAVIQH
jgi:hypothetical protein